MFRHHKHFSPFHTEIPENTWIMCFALGSFDFVHSHWLWFFIHKCIHIQPIKMWYIISTICGRTRKIKEEPLDMDITYMYSSTELVNSLSFCTDTEDLLYKMYNACINTYILTAIHHLQHWFCHFLTQHLYRDWSQQCYLDPNLESFPG